MSPPRESRGRTVPSRGRSAERAVSRRRDRRRAVTTNTLPRRTCPHCGSQVLKVVRYSQLSYECTRLECGCWGPWDEATKKGD